MCKLGWEFLPSPKDDIRNFLCSTQASSPQYSPASAHPRTPACEPGIKNPVLKSYIKKGITHSLTFISWFDEFSKSIKDILAQKCQIFIQHSNLPNYNV